MATQRDSFFPQDSSSGASPRDKEELGESPRNWRIPEGIKDTTRLSGILSSLGRYISSDGRLSSLRFFVSSHLSGKDSTLVTGTSGATDTLAKWNADGDLVASSATEGEIRVIRVPLSSFTSSTGTPTFTVGTPAIPGRWEFPDSGTQDEVTVDYAVPENWRGSQLGLRYLWADDAADGVNNFRHTAILLEKASGADPTTAMTALVNSSATLAPVGKVSTERDIAVGGTALNASSHLLRLRIGRDSGNAADTNTGVLYLLGVEISIG